MPDSPLHRTAHQDLWRRIEDFQLDLPEATFSFSDRLGRENGWSRRHTRRVIAEYKRFVFLAMTSPHPVTPPVDVDQAWHLHLTYTRSYWELFCGETLGAPLHHEPTTGGKIEGRKFTDWYGRTLQYYASVFGAPPPSDIWPPPEIRLAAASRIRQVSARTHWTIRKPRPRRAMPAVLALLCALVITGCAVRGSSGITTLVMLGGLAMLAFVAFVINKASKRNDDEEEESSGATVIGGEPLIFDSSYDDGDHRNDQSGDDSGDDSGGDSDDGGGSDSGGDSGCSGCGGCGGD